jgi:pyridoxamine 5'-phosphate oxidase
MLKLANIRREYGHHELQESSLPDDPLIVFNAWLTEELNCEDNDPTAMVLATVDAHGHPDSRVVLLKEITNNQFVFYTNYESTKAQQLKHQAYAALNFYWRQLARQIRIRGRVEKLPAKQSDAYFATRPRASQCSALVSKQSRVLASREDLEKKLDELFHSGKAIVRPNDWGGYALSPHEFEFWQGRDSRLHDRIKYTLKGTQWSHSRLAP